MSLPCSSSTYSPLGLADLVDEELLDGISGLLHCRGQNVDVALTQGLDLLQQLGVTKGHCLAVDWNEGFVRALANKPTICTNLRLCFT